MPTKGTVPKYFFIAQEIISDINKGILQAGMQVPSENEIIEKYTVSNTTARKALQAIEHRGWVVKIKGRGTFVHKQKVVRSVDRILSFTNNMMQMGFVPSTRLLHTGILKEGYSGTINGRKYSMKGPVFKIHRLRFADDIPMMIEVRYISTKLCPGILDENLEGSLYEIYGKKYHLTLTEVHQMLSATMTDSGSAEFFNILSPMPAILVEGVTFCGREIVLEMEKSVYRGDKYSFGVRAVQNS